MVNRFLLPYVLCLGLILSPLVLSAQDEIGEAELIAIDTLVAKAFASPMPDSDTLHARPAILERADGESPEVPLSSADSMAASLPTDSLFNDSLELVAQQMLEAYNDTAAPMEVTIPKDRWVPDPKKALWLAIVFPGGGQIYNRKYWKLPLFYGGFVGCLYAMNWNNTMYHDYAQAYLDIMDDDDNSVSYMNFLPESYDVESNLSRLQSLFKKKKDYYRRYRDLSFFCLLGVYALSILDAYIDAELSSFDISRDLTMKVRPSVITDHATASSHLSTLQTNSYGVQCAINF